MVAASQELAATLASLDDSLIAAGYNHGARAPGHSRHDSVLLSYHWPAIAKRACQHLCIRSLKYH